MKKVFIILIPIILIPLLGFGVIWLANYKTTFPVPTSRPNTDFVTAISRSTPSLFDQKGKPVFTIHQVTQLAPHWYIVSIQPKTVRNSVVGKVIINDPYFSATYMNVVAGPESKFSNYELQQLRLPGNVTEGIIK